VRIRAGLLAASLAFCAAGDARAQADPAKQGELIFNIGGCTSCHTAKGGQLLAGGDPLRTPFGSFYPPNITPDPETGIGGWSEADLARAMREGKAPDGTPFYPSFPYTSYTHLTDEDVRALKAYLDTVPPVRQPSKPHELGFPYSQRWGLHAWQLAFFEPARFQPDPAKDAVWNRGAYLVEGPGHCQECHTPRNLAGARQADRAFAGGPDPSDATGKKTIPNITQDPDVGLGKWEESDIVTVLTLGMLPDGDFIGGEMAKVVTNATGKLPPEDVQAIATYLKSLPARR
jgi:mono/diheme cytochrome c family protein